MIESSQGGCPPSHPGAFAGTERFRPIAFVGRGSMGAVYRVRDEELGCDVALKTLNELSPEQVYRLKAEFRAVAGVVHPNLVQLHELVVTDELCFFTMEFVDGVDFVRHVRGAAADVPDEAAMLARFAAAAPQLVRAVAALHAAGRLHRDVKPSNVRVTAQGHVVLLDFDLATTLADDGRLEHFASAVAGTFAYMAPEQAWGANVGSAADAYAVGAVFYEALAGRLPFEGTAAAVLAAKERGQPPPLRSLAPFVPDALDALTAELLRREPEARPRLEAVELRLRAIAAEPQPALAAGTPRTPFVGRRRELEELRAFAARRREGAAVACVHGVSGIGKTELLRRLVAELEADPETLVLRGRCHPQEAVAYKAIDPLVDALSRFIVREDEAEQHVLLPTDTAALVRLFPVLARIPAAAKGRRRDSGEDAVELRRRGFAAVREMLSRVAGRRRLVLWIDDLQWADSDSATLLGAMLSPPDPPPTLLLASYRREGHDHPLRAALESIAGESGSGGLLDLALGPLDAADAEELAASLTPEVDASRLAAQSGGSPYLLAELARYASPRGAGALRSDLEIDDLILARLGDQPSPARDLVELVAVAGGPIDRSVLLRAAEQAESGRLLISRLEAECLVRSTTLGERPGIETYHDRIRDAVVGALGAEDLAVRHRDLAVAFESSGAGEPEVLAHHFHGAGLPAKAADYAVAAADRALDSLAFVRAAEFYGRARRWDPRDAAWQRVLLTREGEALASASRFADAARVFIEAAEGASPLDALELRRRATEQVFAAGRFDEGIEVLSALLADLGIDFPRTPRRVLLGSAARVGRLILSGVDRRSPAASADREEMVRIDTCFSVGRNLVNVDSALGVYFSLEGLRRALVSADPLRLGRSLCIVGGSLAAAGGRLLAPLGERMIRRAETIAAETGSPLLLGTIAVGTGQVAMIQGRWRLALERCDGGIRLLSESCRGVAYECNVARGNAQRALEELGDIDALEPRARESLQAALTTGARHAEMAAAQHLSMALLARDDVDSARELSRRGDEIWSRQGFHMQHFYALRQQGYCDLYDGDPRASYERLCAAWPALKRSNLLRISLLRVDALSIRARLALAVAAQDGAPAEKLVCAAEGDARALAREHRLDACTYAHLLHAGVASIRRDAEKAIAHLEQAERAAAEAEMALHAACAEHRRGEIAGGASGGALRDAAVETMLRRGVRRPEAWLRLQAPGAWPSV